jgi:hypothetical protein
MWCSTYAKGTVPDELGDDTERARDTEQDGVEVLLVEAVAWILSRALLI